MSEPEKFCLKCGSHDSRGLLNHACPAEHTGCWGHGSGSIGRAGSTLRPGCPRCGGGGVLAMPCPGPAALPPSRESVPEVRESIRVVQAQMRGEVIDIDLLDPFVREEVEAIHDLLSLARAPGIVS